MSVGGYVGKLGKFHSNIETASAIICMRPIGPLIHLYLPFAAV